MVQALPASPRILPRTSDEYRFGTGSNPVLQPGTLGWTAADLQNPDVRALWDAGRYEIIDGVLALMPAARFRGGMVVDNLKFLIKRHCHARGEHWSFSGEIDIELGVPRLVRADSAGVGPTELPKFQSLRFNTPGTDWRDHPLTLPPMVVIESISIGNELHDRETKAGWYAEFGVPHYWLLNAYDKSFECLRLGESKYQVDQIGHGAGKIRPSLFPGLVIALADVWGDT